MYENACKYLMCWKNKDISFFQQKSNFSKQIEESEYLCDKCKYFYVTWDMDISLVQVRLTW